MPGYQELVTTNQPVFMFHSGAFRSQSGGRQMQNIIVEGSLMIPARHPRNDQKNPLLLDVSVAESGRSQ